MKILIVTAHFPPKNAVSSLRPYSFAKYWHRAGHDITVITAFKNKSQNDLALDCSFIKIIRVAVPLLSKFSDWNPSLDASNSQNNKINDRNLIKKILNLSKKFLIAIVEKTGCFSDRFPSLYDLWAKNSIKLVDPQDYDIVLSTGGPYSVHKVGQALKKKNNKIKWIVDWRDLWTKNPNYKGCILFYPLEFFMEQKFHKNADLITMVETNTIALSKKTSTRVITIYNGFDPDDFVEIQKENRNENDAYTIVYTGQFYRKLQDISPFFIAISRIKKKEPLLFKKLRIQFAGKNTDVRDIAEKNNISEIYNYLGFLGRDEALKLQYNADAVLFVDYKENKTKTGGLLSGKIFEYINTSRKIIAIGNKANTPGVELIKKTNTGIYLGNNIDLIEQHLIECITNTEKNKYVKNDALIQEYTRKNQANKLLNNIMELPQGNK